MWVSTRTPEGRAAPGRERRPRAPPISWRRDSFRGICNLVASRVRTTKTRRALGHGLRFYCREHRKVVGSEEREAGHVPVHIDLDVTRAEVRSRKTGEILGQKLGSAPPCRNILDLGDHRIAVTVVNLDNGTRGRIVWIKNGDSCEIDITGSDLTQRHPALETRSQRQRRRKSISSRVAENHASGQSNAAASDLHVTLP